MNSLKSSYGIFSCIVFGVNHSLTKFSSRYMYLLSLLNSVLVKEKFSSDSKTIFQ